MGGITPDEVRRHLNDVLSSPDFANSQRIKNFLTYIVETSLAGKAESLKAYTIALEVFDLGDNFDSRLNPLIRTEARRLRSKLDHYYLENPQAPIRISIPKGGYAALFSRSPSDSKHSAGNSEEGLTIEQLKAKGTILLLPFENIGNDLEAEKFSAALLKEISYNLSRFYNLNVIDFQFSTMLTPCPTPTEEELKPLLEKHRARFVLGGSIQIEDEQLRLWAVLRDTTTHYNIWTEKFDYELGSASRFQLQDEIAEAIIYKIAGEFGVINHTLLKEYTAAKKTDSAVDEAMILYSSWLNLLTKESFILVLETVERAINIYPDNPDLLAILADLYAEDWQMCYNTLEQPLEKSMDTVSRALLLDPQHQLALQTMALNCFVRNNPEKYVEFAEKAIAVNPRESNTLTALGSWYGFLGMWDRALELTHKVQNMNPSTPSWCHSTLAIYYFTRQDYQTAFDEACKINTPKHIGAWIVRCISSVYLGLKDETRIAWQKLLENCPEYQSQTTRIALIRQMFVNEEYVQLVEAGLKEVEALLASEVQNA
ncbi:MAG: hypothetical protein IJD04_01770 [Desulfovibrionaceae bacterium]|nr:hypothetical protein [Desulfovibrionaceae bacterium]